MKRYIEIFSDGTINYNYNFSTPIKKLTFFEKDHINFSLNIKQKINIVKNLGQSSKYKNKYLY
jgi:hypothetical protein